MVVSQRNAGAYALLALAVALSGCGRPSSRAPEVKFGVEQNDIRKRVGLPLVDPDWRNASLDFETLVWSSPFGAQRGHPSRYDKLVVYDHGQIVEEVDFYTNGKPYALELPTGTSPRFESIVIHYNYERAARGASPWACALTRGQQDEELSLDQAENMLTSWGIRRID